LADLVAYGLPHKRSPISCRSSVGQGKFAGHRPTFYHCATHSGRTAYINLYHRLLLAFVVLGLVSSVSSQEISWERRLRNDLLLCRVGRRTFTQSSLLPITSMLLSRSWPVGDCYEVVIRGEAGDDRIWGVYSHSPTTESPGPQFAWSADRLWRRNASGLLRLHQLSLPKKLKPKLTPLYGRRDALKSVTPSKISIRRNNIFFKSSKSAYKTSRSTKHNHMCCVSLLSVLMRYFTHVW